MDGENRVQLREVQMGVMRGNQWQVVSGLEQGERVVVDGVNKLQPGSPVEPVVVSPSE